MTIHTISPTGLALYITPSDLSEYGLTPATLTPEYTAQIVRRAFAAAGVAAGGRMELEAYPDVGGVLVFAQLMPAEELVFAFADSEALIRAVQVLPAADGEGALRWWDGQYWLSLPGDARCAAILSEFGQDKSAAHPRPDAARPLLRGDVIGMLKHYFRQ